MNAETCVEEILERDQMTVIASLDERLRSADVYITSLHNRLAAARMAVDVLESHYKLIEKHHTVIPLKDMIGYQHLKSRIDPDETVSQMRESI